MNYHNFAIFLVILVIVGTFSGAYAINTTSPTDKTVINLNKNKNNTHADGSKILYVANNGTDRNDGLSPTKPKRNIIIAINVANPGDTIIIAPGTYQENLQIDKNITLIGNNPNNTIIDGHHADICINIKSGVTANINNFTIKNGEYQGYGHSSGGGIHNEGVLSLKNSKIMNNNGNYGGGIDNEGAMDIIGVTIKNNKAEYSGGGILTDSDSITTVENSTITQNEADQGGGINSWGKQITISNSKITNNNAKGKGGGIYNSDYLTVEDSVISNNTAEESGGGIFTCNKITCIYAVTITNNKAKEGGGICTGLAREKTQIYIDNLTKILNNTPDNYRGEPYIPA